MNISEKDKAYVWHPFTHLKNAEENILIEKAEGVYLIDDKGNKIIDAIASWWVNLHGHCHPYISEKVAKQVMRMEHSIFSGFTHQGAVELAARLLEYLPKGQSKIFYSDNGSTAVEVGLKMALQYWHNQGEYNKNTFIALESAYHGDTFGGMSVGARNVFNNAFENLLFNVIHIPLPDAENISELKQTIALWAQQYNIAGFIFEPLVQGAGGMFMYEAEHLDELIALCKEHKIITIADEVMTGFGRTGRFFASDHLKNTPDVICLSKGLTGGYMPLGVTSCAQFIHEGFISDERHKTFFHGHSFTANPTACAAALASLDLMEKKETFESIGRIHARHKKFAGEIQGHKNLKATRLKGVILALELQTGDETHYLNGAAETIASFFLDKKILLRPLGNVFYILPPYCISDDDLSYIYQSIKEFLDKY